MKSGMVLFARVVNIPGIHTVDRIVTPGATFISVNRTMNIYVHLFTGSISTMSSLTIGGFLDTANINMKIARIYIPPDEKQKPFVIELYDTSPIARMSLDGSGVFPSDGNVFPPVAPNVFPEVIPYVPLQLSQQILQSYPWYSVAFLTSGASYSGNGAGFLVIHAIGAGGNGGNGGGASVVGSTCSATGSGGGGGGNGAVVISSLPYSNYNISCTAAAQPSGAAANGGSSTCYIFDLFSGATWYVVAGGGGGGGNGGNGSCYSFVAGAAGLGGAGGVGSTNIPNSIIINGLPGTAGFTGQSSSCSSTTYYGGTGGSAVAQSPYYTYTKTTYAYTTAIITVPGGAPVSSGGNASCFGQGAGGGGGANVTDCSSGTGSGGNGTAGAGAVNIYLFTLTL
jgi:hypothetical protein